MMPLEEKERELNASVQMATNTMLQLSAENNRLKNMIQKMRFEIEDKARRKRTWIKNECLHQAEGLEEAVEIIDKYLKEVENADSD